MRYLRFLLLFVGVCVFALTSVSAQNGAIIERGEAGGTWYEWDGDNMLLIYSTHSEFFCEPGYQSLIEYQVVSTPVGADRYKDHGNLFTRVWFATEDDLFATGNPWDFICNGEQVAEGIITSTYVDNNLNGPGPGANVWGFSFSGALYDLGDLCEGGMVYHNLVRRFRVAPNADWPACWPGCVETVAFHGPRLSCDD